MKNVHPCDFKPIQHILSVHSNVTAVTTMCFIGGIAFMTVVDWGNALFVPLGHLLDHPIFIIIVTITPSSSSSKVIFHIIPVLRMSSVFGSSKISLAHLLKFIAISIAIPFAVSTIEIEGEGGFQDHWGIVSHCPNLFHHLSSFEPPPPPLLLSPGVYNQPLTVFNEHTHTNCCTIRQISPS